MAIIDDDLPLSSILFCLEKTLVFSTTEMIAIKYV